MDGGIDIGTRAAPEAASTTPTLEPPAPARPWQGHRPKIRAALGALAAEGLLPPHLRPIARYRIVIDQLMRDGYALDLPGRDAVEREYQRWLRAPKG